MKKLLNLTPFILLVFAIFSGFIIYKAAYFAKDYHFSSLAQSFVHGDLFLSPVNLPPGDFVDYRGKQYLFFGPMPSILLMPFVLFFGRDFPQITLSIFSIIIIYLAIFKLCRKFEFKSTDSIYLSNFFVFGTVLYFVGIVNISAYLVQAVATMFVVLSLLEYFGKKRWFLIGLLTAGAFATRATLFLICLFFLIEVLRQRKTINISRTLTLFLIPIVFTALVLGIYNFRRFHSFLDTGYTRNVTVLSESNYNNKLGWFNPIHIPANLYALLIMSPEPVKRENVTFALEFPFVKASGMGMAIWFTSPLFVYLIASRRKAYTLSALIAIAFLLIPSLFYFGIGTSQYGYRYALDFIPLLFLLLLPAFGKTLPNFAKILIVGGMIFNTLYMLSIWDIYPLFNIGDYLKF